MKFDIPSGLYYFPGVVSEDLQNRLYAFFKDSSLEWSRVGSSETSREVLQYGYEYSYKSGNIDKPAQEIPIEILELQNLLRNSNVIPNEIPLNQVLINKYLPGQGISAHVDSPKFMDYVASFTLFAGAEIEFTKAGKDRFCLYVNPNSLYVMSGESRYEWKHEMRARKSDIVNGKKIPREQRISVTFRSVPMK